MNIQTITDLCIAINAVEGIEVAPKFIKQNERVRNTLYNIMIETATNLYLGYGQDRTKPRIKLSQLNKALKAAGWDGVTFVECLPNLRIVTK